MEKSVDKYGLTEEEAKFLYRLRLWLGKECKDSITREVDMTCDPEDRDNHSGILKRAMAVRNILKIIRGD